MPVSSEIKKRFEKTRICAHFQNGVCHRGDRCSFAHTTDELKTRPDLTCTKMCKSVLRGRPCSLLQRGETCMFAHDPKLLRCSSKGAYKTSICKFWETTKGCKLGEFCRFAHGPEDLREVDSEDDEELREPQAESLATPDTTPPQHARRERRRKASGSDRALTMHQPPLRHSLSGDTQPGFPLPPLVSRQQSASVGPFVPVVRGNEGGATPAPPPGYSYIAVPTSSLDQFCSNLMTDFSHVAVQAQINAQAAALAMGILNYPQGAVQGGVAPQLMQGSFPPAVNPFLVQGVGQTMGGTEGYGQEEAWNTVYLPPPPPPTQPRREEGERKTQRPRSVDC